MGFWRAHPVPLQILSDILMATSSHLMSASSAILAILVAWTLECVALDNTLGAETPWAFHHPGNPS